MYLECDACGEEQDPEDCAWSGKVAEWDCWACQKANYVEIVEDTYSD